VTSNFLFFQIESLAVLAKSKLLDDAVALASVEALLADSRRASGATPASTIAIDAPEGTQMFGAHARQAILESLNTGSPAELRRIHRVLEQRWTERRAQLAPSANTAGSTPVNCELGWERRIIAYAGNIQHCTQASENDRAEADLAYQEWERSLSAVERRLAGQAQQNSSDSLRSTLSSPFGFAALGAAAFGLLATIGGQSLVAIVLLALVGALCSMGARILLRARTTTQPRKVSAASRLAKQLLQPAADALISHYQAVEHAARHDFDRARFAGIIENLTRIGTPLREVERLAREAVNNIGSGIFRPVDEGKVLVVGSDLARQLAGIRSGQQPSSEFYKRIMLTFRAQSGLSLTAAAEQMPVTDLLNALKTAAAVHTLSFSLADVICAIGQSPEGKRQFWGVLDTLHRAALSSVRLKRGLDFEIDQSLSPANCMFGLPGGPQDPLASVIRERFPDTTFFHSFDADAIEIYFDRRNLSRTHLLWDELSREPYEHAPSFERQSQWHFPRRLRGGPEVVSSPDQMSAAV
jgi:hypothetical protein